MVTYFNPYEMLLSYLDERQRRDFETYGGFFVISDDERVFWLHNGIELLLFEDRAQLCGYHGFAVGPDGYEAPRDVSLITQLLLLQTDSWALVRVACHNNPSRTPTADPPPMKGHLIDRSVPWP